MLARDLATNESNIGKWFFGLPLFFLTPACHHVGQYHSRARLLLADRIANHAQMNNATKRNDEFLSSLLSRRSVFFSATYKILVC